MGSFQIASSSSSPSRIHYSSSLFLVLDKTKVVKCRRGTFVTTKSSSSSSETIKRQHSKRQQQRSCSSNSKNKRRVTNSNKRGHALIITSALPSVGTAQWLFEQGSLSILALSAFLFRDRIKALVGSYSTRSDDKSSKEEGSRRENFFQLGREDCPTCEGSGFSTCPCTKWSNDGEGCGNCNYTCRTICPSCRGGGKGVRATLDLKVDSKETDRENIKRRQKDRETFAEASSSTLFNPLTTPLICLPMVVSAPESNENRERRSASSSSSSSNSTDIATNQNKKEPDDEFYAQSGEAIRTLRDDYPFFLKKEPRFSIFREDVGLIDATCTFGRNRDPESLIDGSQNGGYVMARGLNHYKRVFKVIRTIAAVIFSSCSVQVTRIWSPLSTTGKRTIRVRWSVRGHIRLGAAIGVDVAQFDGISEYKLDKAGYIYEHVITDLDWDVAQLRERVVAMMGAVNKSPSISGQF